MSTAKSPLQDKRPNKNAIIGIITSSLKREESTKKSDRILKHLLPNAPNALRGQRSYSTKAKPVLLNKDTNNKTFDPPVRKNPAFAVYRDVPIDTVASRKSPFTTHRDKRTKTVTPKKTTFALYRDEHASTRSIKPKSTFALTKRSNQDTFGTDLFSTTDTPIYTLSNDCLLAIFELCGDLENYCTLLTVCRRWRSLASQPYLWRSINSEWIHFNKKIGLLHQPNQAFHQLEYVQKLTITNSNRSAIRNSELDLTKISPLEQLKELNLIQMDMVDIVYLTSWLQNITVLRCQNTQISKRRNFYMASFDRLEYLKTLEIHFENPCALNYHHFTLGTSPSLGSRLLPKTIQTFSLANIYDMEEYLDLRLHRIYNDTAVDPLDLEDLDGVTNDWLGLEHNLVMKYRMLTSLCNLRSLTLGRVSSFTARVWRECLIPCCSNLEHLSMKHWTGLGRRESPQSIVNRRLQQDDTLMDDVEAALSEFISSLKDIKTIRLDDFQCGPGLVQGVTKLAKKYTIDTAFQQGEHVKMSHYHDKLLDNCLISFTS